jgi:hypothetical protein
MKPPAGSPPSGLPAGMVVTSASGNGTFQLQSEFESNSLLLDNASPAGTLTLAAPSAYRQLAIFDATGSGSGAISYTLHFVGGATETGAFTSPDWFGGAPVAYTATGRVNNVFTGMIDNVGSTNPRLYEHLLTVQNTTGLVQSISLTRATVDGHTAIFALSGNPVPENGRAPRLRNRQRSAAARAAGWAASLEA